MAQPTPHSTQQKTPISDATSNYTTTPLSTQPQSTQPQSTQPQSTQPQPQSTQPQNLKAQITHLHQQYNIQLTKIIDKKYKNDGLVKILRPNQKISGNKPELIGRIHLLFNLSTATLPIRAPPPQEDFDSIETVLYHDAQYSRSQKYPN
jgi:hypothetical protein